MEGGDPSSSAGASYGALVGSAKQIAVCARALKPDMAAVLRERVDQNPVRFNPSSPRSDCAYAGQAFNIQHSTFNIE